MTSGYYVVEKRGIFGRSYLRVDRKSGSAQWTDQAPAATYAPLKQAQLWASWARRKNPLSTIKILVC